MIERRTHERIAATQSARILFNYRSVLACQVRDLSVAGAGLEVDANVAIPDTFDLICNVGGESHSCRLIWRIKERAGAAFDDV